MQHRANQFAGTSVSVTSGDPIQSVNIGPWSAIWGDHIISYYRSRILWSAFVCYCVLVCPSYGVTWWIINFAHQQNRRATLLLRERTFPGTISGHCGWYFNVYFTRYCIPNSVHILHTIFGSVDTGIVMYKWFATVIPKKLSRPWCNGVKYAPLLNKLWCNYFKENHKMIMIIMMIITLIILLLVIITIIKIMITIIIFNIIII